MGGQASHFLRYAPAGQDYATVRYTKELNRLLTVLEKRLEKSVYVAGDEYTIADMAIWPGRASAFVMGMGLDDWPAMRGWFERIRERPAVERAMAREDLKAPAKYVGRSEEHTSELQSLMRISYAVFCLKKKNYKIHTT